MAILDFTFPATKPLVNGKGAAELGEARKDTDYGANFTFPPHVKFYPGSIDSYGKWAPKLDNFCTATIGCISSTPMEYNAKLYELRMTISIAHAVSVAQTIASYVKSNGTQAKELEALWLRAERCGGSYLSHIYMSWNYIIDVNTICYKL